MLHVACCIIHKLKRNAVTCVALCGSHAIALSVAVGVVIVVYTSFPYAKVTNGSDVACNIMTRMDGSASRRCTMIIATCILLLLLLLFH